MIDKKDKIDSDGNDVITSSDIKYIMDVNQKAVQIYVEVEKQQEDIIEILDETSDKIENLTADVKTIKANQELLILSVKKIDDIDKNLFRLIVLLGSISIGAIITIIQNFLKK